MAALPGAAVLADFPACIAEQSVRPPLLLVCPLP